MPFYAPPEQASRAHFDRFEQVVERAYEYLVEPRDLDRVSIKDVSTIYEEPDRKGMVQTRLSEGVLFSPRMYVSP